MKIIRMNPLESRGSGKTLAYFDVQTDDEILMKGFRLVNGVNGLFVSSPNVKGKDGKYYETIVLPKPMKTTLDKLAKEEYSKIE